MKLSQTFSCCSHAHPIYTLLPVTLQRKTRRLLMLTGLLGLTAGCSGINASKSVSPLDFLIPSGGGLMRGLLYLPPPPPQNPLDFLVPARETVAVEVTHVS
jgi:hypothetical protein